MPTVFKTLANHQESIQSLIDAVGQVKTKIDSTNGKLSQEALNELNSLKQQLVTMNQSIQESLNVAKAATSVADQAMSAAISNNAKDESLRAEFELLRQSIAGGGPFPADPNQQKQQLVGEAGKYLVSAAHIQKLKTFLQ